jgi:AraC-like DNA-binding protein
VRRPAVALSRHLLRVRDLIDRAYAEPLDVAALARSASVSSAYFIRSFKSAFGETPHQCLMNRRLERAMALLRAGDRSVIEVCFAVGFSSLGSFSTQFRRFVGDSPSAHRRRDERLYGIDAGFRDPFGNHWRLTQQKLVPPSA